MMTADRKQILDQIVADYAASRPDDLLAFAHVITAAVLISTRKPPVPEKDLCSHFLQMMFFQTATPEEKAQREAKYAAEDLANAKKREARAAKEAARRLIDSPTALQALRTTATKARREVKKWQWELTNLAAAEAEVPPQKVDKLVSEIEALARVLTDAAQRMKTP